MATLRQNFEMWAGDAKNISVAVVDNVGAALNLTGYTITWRLAQHVSLNPVITKAAPDVVIDDPAGGKFTVKLAAPDTATLDGVYYHEARIEDAAGNVTTVLTGYATINGGGR